MKFFLMKVFTVILLMVLYISSECIYAQGYFTRGFTRDVRRANDMRYRRTEYSDKEQQISNKKGRKNKKNEKKVISMANDDIKLVVSGDGKSKEEAIFIALRSAIEQTFGTFVSSNTSLVNDELTRDEIVSISSGNVKQYNVIYEKFENGRHYVTLDAIVSIGKLISFAQSRGTETELAGATFAMNLKMMELNKRNEETALSNLCSQILEICKTTSLFNYSIKVSEPKYSEGWNVVNCDAKITIMPNSNAFAVEELIANTCNSLNLSEEERKKMRDMGLTVYALPKDFYNRREKALDIRYQKLNYNVEYYFLRNPEVLESFFDIVPKYDFMLIDNLGGYLPKVEENDDKKIYIGGCESSVYFGIYYEGKRIKERGYYIVPLYGLEDRVFMKSEILSTCLEYTPDEIAKVSNIRIEPFVTAPNIVKMDSISISLYGRISSSDVQYSIKMLNKFSGETIKLNGNTMTKEGAIHLLKDR